MSYPETANEFDLNALIDELLGGSSNTNGDFQPPVYYFSDPSENLYPSSTDIAPSSYGCADQNQTLDLQGAVSSYSYEDLDKQETIPFRHSYEQELFENINRAYCEVEEIKLKQEENAVLDTAFHVINEREDINAEGNSSPKVSDDNVLEDIWKDVEGQNIFNVDGSFNTDVFSDIEMDSIDAELDAELCQIVGDMCNGCKDGNVEFPN